VTEGLQVAVVGPTHPYKGGVAQHTTELAHRLTAAGHTVELLSWSEQYPAFLYPGQQRVPGDRPERTPFPRTTYPLSWRRPDSWVRVGRRLRSYDVVVVVVVSPVQAPAYAALLASLGGRGPRVVALCHNVLPHEQRPGDRQLTRAVLSRVDGVVTHTPEQAALARTVTRARVEAVPLPATLPGKGRGRGEVGRQDGTVPNRRLLFFGLVRPYKGVDVLLRAMAQVPDVELTVAGEVWGGAEPLTRLVDELGLRDRVELRAGYVDDADVPGLFDSVDALVLPYRSGTATQNVTLAHAHGLPVVATDIPALAPHVRDGVDGLLCRPDDVEDLARALRDLYAPGRLGRLAVNVPEVDPGPGWTSYVATVLRAAGERPPAAGPPASAAGQVAAPPGGAALELAKRAAELALWSRVEVQAAVESRAGRRRPVPVLVRPTAVLSSREEYEAACREARRLRLPLHRDSPKNWDALGAVATVLSSVGRSARVLDAGSARYSSVLPWLRLYGATELVGINLEFGAEVRRGPVRFRYGDITATGFPDASFDAVTCMSVIEHGVPVPEFLAEAARILRPGGVLSLSTDYDSAPPDTTGITAYGVPVRILGPDDVRELVGQAEAVGLRLIGDLALDHLERPVHWKRTGLDYTFVLLGFRRD
jgi:glycosyltransferase involved in cell wall biosynthesis/SAM-dependent methyltransferase